MQWNLWIIKHRSNWKCCWEEKPAALFVAWDIVLILNFSDKKRVWKTVIQELHHKSSVEISEIKELIDCIKAQKLPMLKQGVKIINAEFIWTRALSQLSFVEFRPYASFFLMGLFSLTVMPKSKTILETSLDLTHLFETSVRPDAWVEGLISNVDCLENRRRTFIRRKYGRKRRLPAHTFRSLDCDLSFCMDFLHRW